MKNTIWMKKAAVVFCAAVCAAAFAACGQKTVKESGAAAESKTEAESKGFQAELNYDYANTVNNDAEAVIKLLGEPESDRDDGVIRAMSFDGGKKKALLYNENEDVNYGRSNSCWALEASVGELFVLSEEPESSEAFFEALRLEEKPEKQSSRLVDGYALAEGKEVYHFFCDGYEMEILPESDGSIHRDSRAVILAPLEKEEPESEESEEETETAAN